MNSRQLAFCMVSGVVGIGVLSILITISSNPEYIDLTGILILLGIILFSIPFAFFAVVNMVTQGNVEKFMNELKGK